LVLKKEVTGFLVFIDAYLTHKIEKQPVLRPILGNSCRYLPPAHNREADYHYLPPAGGLHSLKPD
jgi:hypothetical protein